MIELWNSQLVFRLQLLNYTNYTKYQEVMNFSYIRVHGGFELLRRYLTKNFIMRNKNRSRTKSCIKRETGEVKYTVKNNVELPSISLKPGQMS